MRNSNDSEITPTLSEASSETNTDPKSETHEELRKPPAKPLTRSPKMTDIQLHDIEGSKELADEGSVGPPTFDQAATKKLVRKLDWRLLPYLCLIYMLCFLDRTNVGNARLFHMEDDLGMTGMDYNVALSLLFPFYVLSEIPSNMLLKKIRASVWFTAIMLAWASVMTLTGLIKNYAGLLVCRVFLGIAEGGLFPGVSFYLTMWYPRHETGLRMAIFFSAATIAGAFGGFLARAIGMMDGVGSMPAWAWIFLLEGLLTFVVALFCPFAVSDYPKTAKFLTEDERAEVRRRLTDDSDQPHAFEWRFVMQAFTDWKIYVNMVISIGIFAPLYSISLFLPTILKELGYSTDKSQLMTVPIYTFAFVCTIFGSYMADKFRQRGIFLLGFELCAIMGFLLLITNDDPNVQYAGCFFAAGGIYSLVPLIGAWNSNNLGGSLKRAVGIGMQVAFGNLGGTIASFIYLAQDEPRFIQGHTILIALISMSFVITLYMTIWFRLENASRAKTLDTGRFSADILKVQEEELGDKAVSFKYMT